MGLSVMIVGSGAREHAISLAYENSPQIERIIVTPGNDFIAFGRKKNVIIYKGCSLKKPETILEIAKKYSPDIIDVAQDDALAAGTVDLLQNHGFKVFGPTKDAARIEWDKGWSREFMKRHNIPHPEFRYFSDEEEARQYVRDIYHKDPSKLLFIKATGLCAGKGALKSENLGQATGNINKMKEFGDAGKIFLVEEGLKGEEFSFYAISDGKSYKLFKSAQDNKTVDDFDKGDQTGGMGAISPARITEGLEPEIEENMIARLVSGMQEEGHPYKGIIYFGGIALNGKPNTIEYNARWGDPECQVVLPGLKNDYVDLVLASIEGRLDKVSLQQDDKVRVCVVLTSRGYPNDYSEVKGKRIFGIESTMKMPGVTIFGAGINMNDGKFYANGGRLLSVVAEGNNILEARERAYSAAAKINIEGNNKHLRNDIGWRDVERFLKEKQ